MFHIGDLIIYGSEGVCRVEEIGVPNIPTVDKNKLFYTLSPLYRNGKVFTPVDTNVFMRYVISHDEAQAIIKQIPTIIADVYENRNMRMLNNHYQEMLETHDCADAFQLISDVYTKREVVTERGKKLGQTDERYMKRAEDLLYGEFAVALGIPKDDVKGYISDAVEKLESAKKS